MKKYILKYNLLFLLLISLNSCEGFLDHFRDKTKIAELEFELPAFDTIHVLDVFNVHLIQDSSYCIRIAGDAEIINDVKAKVSENTLVLTNEYAVKWLKPKSNDVDLFISYASLSKVKVSQTSMIETVNPIGGEEFGVVFEGKLAEANLELNCNTFYYWNNHPCGGKLNLSGQVEQLKLWNFALTEIDALQLKTERALVDNHSLSHCWVNPNVKLEYSIQGAGNIYYTSDPEIVEIEESLGDGKLIKLED